MDCQPAASSSPDTHQDVPSSEESPGLDDFLSELKLGLNLDLKDIQNDSNDAGALESPCNSDWDTLRMVLRSICDESYMEEMENKTTELDVKIENLCSMHYENFVKAVRELEESKITFRCLKEVTSAINSEIQESSGLLLSAAAEVKSAVILRKNIQMAIETLSHCLPILEMYARLEQEMLMNRFVKSIKGMLPKFEDAMKSAVKTELKDFLERLHPINALIGKFAMLQTAEEQESCLGSSLIFSSLQNGSFCEAESDMMQANPLESVDFTPVLRAFHIFSSLGERETFINDYRFKRKKQAQMLLHPPHNMHESLEALREYLHSILGMFLVEDHLLTLTESWGILSKEYLESFWETSFNEVVSFLQMSIGSCMEASLIVDVKDNLLLFSHTLRAYGFAVEKLSSLWQDLQDHYMEILMQQWIKIFWDIFEEDNYQAMEVEDADELQQITSDGEDEGFPRRIPFSLMVPKVYSQVKSFVAQFHRFSSDLGMRKFEVDEAVRKATGLLLSRTLNGSLCSLLRDSSLGLTPIIQIFVNMNCLEDVIPHLDLYISQFTGIYGEICPEEDRQVLQEAKAEAEQGIYDRLREKVTKLVEQADYNWMLEEAQGYASPYINDLIAFLENTFRSFTHLPTSVAQRGCWLACHHLSKMLLDMLLDEKMEQMTQAALVQLNLDVIQCEHFACSKPVEGINEDSMLLCFAQLRQILDLLLTWDWNKYFEDFDKEGSKYNRISPQVALMLLNRLLDKEGQPMFSMPKEMDKRKVYETLHKQLQQLCDATITN